MSQHGRKQAAQFGASPLVGALKNIPAIVRTHWRSFAVGLSAGGVVALMNLGANHSASKRQPSPPAPLLLAATDATSASEGTWVSNPLPVTEVTLDEIVIRRSPITWQAEATTIARIELETRDVLVSGRAVAAVIMLKRTGNTSGRVSVRCRTIPGSATPAQDYESLSTIVQFGDRQAMRTLFVPILQQPPNGESRTFSVSLERAPRGPSLGTVTSTTVTILGDG